MARAKRRGGRGNTGSQESPSSQDLHAGHGGDAASNGSPAPTENGAHRDLSPGQEDKDDERWIAQEDGGGLVDGLKFQAAGAVAPAGSSQKNDDDREKRRRAAM